MTFGKSFYQKFCETSVITFVTDEKGQARLLFLFVIIEKV